MREEISCPHCYAKNVHENIDSSHLNIEYLCNSCGKPYVFRIEMYVDVERATCKDGEHVFTEECEEVYVKTREEHYDGFWRVFGWRDIKIKDWTRAESYFCKKCGELKEEIEPFNFDRDKELLDEKERNYVLDIPRFMSYVMSTI